MPQSSSHICPSWCPNGRFYRIKGICVWIVRQGCDNEQRKDKQGLIWWPVSLLTVIRMTLSAQCPPSIIIQRIQVEVNMQGVLSETDCWLHVFRNSLSWFLLQFVSANLYACLSALMSFSPSVFISFCLPFYGLGPPFPGAAISSFYLIKILSSIHLQFMQYFFH